MIMKYKIYFIEESQKREADKLSTKNFMGYYLI